MGPAHHDGNAWRALPGGHDADVPAIRALRKSEGECRFLATRSRRHSGKALAMAFTYEFPRPAVAVDVILLRQREETEVLLVERGNEPFRGRWAIPGGFVEMDEDLPDAARRELREETGIHIAENERLVELGAFGKPGRDPRGRVISVVYLAGVACSQSAAAAGDDAARTEWFPLSRAPELAFDHAEVMAEARRRLADNPAELAPDA